MVFKLLLYNIVYKKNVETSPSTILINKKTIHVFLLLLYIYSL